MRRKVSPPKQEPEKESYTAEQPKSLKLLNKKAPLHHTTLKNIEERKRKERELMRTPTPEEVEFDVEGHPKLKLLNYDTFTTTESTIITSSLVKDILKLYEQAYEERL